MPNSEEKDNMKVEIDYTNYRGERRLRKILPLRIIFGENPYHKDGEQWFVTAVDLETEQIRTFAMKDIHSWKSS